MPPGLCLRRLLGAFKRVLVLLGGVFFLSLSGAQSDAVAIAAGQGYVEAITVDSGKRTLKISGWVAPAKANVFVTNLLIDVAGQEIYRGRFERSERPDVVKATGRNDWLWSGFQVVVTIPSNVANGQSAFKLLARLGDGQTFQVTAPEPLKTIALQAPDSPGAWQLVALSLALALPACVVIYSFITKSEARPWKSLFGVSLLLSFLLLVGAGWTGSSLALALKGSPFIEHGALPWMGQDRAIRSDEWEVLTPLAISQASHLPPYPVSNRLLGTDGQNMMVIGMTGVPVAHLSSVAKPATWGFFIFDLRKALSWYWWFPFFACFGALWLVLIQSFNLEWRTAAALSLTGAASPYSVVFSGWPAYTAFFAAVAVLAWQQIFLRQKFWHASLFGMLLGWALAGFALVLYPSWQIKLTYLLVPLSLAWVWTERRRLNFGVSQWLAIAVATLVAVAILGSWWLAAHDAVAAIRSTVYPGGRSLEVGGDIDPWFLIKGWLSPATIYATSDIIAPSDAGSFLFLLWAAVPAIVTRSVALRKLDPVIGALLAVTVFILAFAFIGFNAQFARFSLLGFTTSYRIDLTLGIAQIFVLAWLMSPTHQTLSYQSIPWKSGFAAFSVLVMVHIAWLFSKLPVAISQMVPPSYALMTFAAIGLASYALLAQRHVWVVCICLVWTLGASLPFNPLGVATNQLVASDELRKAISAIDHNSPSPAVAVIGERAWAVALPGVGIHVVNTVFYYPQKSLWAALDPEHRHAVVHNRYHRLLLTLQSLPPGATHSIESPRLDEVRVSLDPERFDFRLLGAKAVLLTPAEGKKLRGNRGLTLVKATDQWELFRVSN